MGQPVVVLQVGVVVGMMVKAVIAMMAMMMVMVMMIMGMVAIMTIVSMVEVAIVTTYLSLSGQTEVTIYYGRLCPGQHYGQAGQARSGGLAL